MNILAQAAQLAEANPALYTYGPLGIICAYFMWRDEKRSAMFREHENRNAAWHQEILHRIDGLTRALLVDMMERENVGKQVRDYATQVIAKIDARSERK